MQVALLHNSGAGQQDVSTDDLVAWLRAAGFEPKCFPLKESLDSDDALGTGEFVIAAGGDGSVRAAALRLAHTGRPLAVLPLGTANNIARSLGIHGSPQEIIAGWKTPLRRRMDLGLARGPWGRKHFIEGVGLGLVGRAISIIESISASSSHEYERREDELHRDLSVFLALAHETAPIDLALRIDGEEVRDAFLLLEVLNISRAGPGIRLADDADSSDGFLDVISVTTLEREKLKENLLQHFRGASSKPLLTSRQARSLQITTTSCDLRVDDELMLRCQEPGSPLGEPVHVELTVDPGAVEILLPR